ncbi:hypothetical protein BI49514_01912 [Brevibacterium iodinum ATCC 49514]|uniref:HTTM-like domain-containing protein n=1 Tax=Brevibacterium iodinum ATCC 49514 TaxID=1255616 RepID=A0A2H1JF09_9MICO|nr:hypothetical protein [Brevibacterium iodinum]SMX85954.1 hypothetical protein BI49514_01912 [Brevibacterium iodinum ATCC 49514]SUW11229.1 Uncharacterised protein [Brevibacterium iodinum]
MSSIPTLRSTPTEAAPTNPFLRWFMPEVPLARVAVFRVFLYLFIIIDVLTISGDVIAHGWTPEFYQPLWLARFLHIPAVSVLGAQILLAAIIVFSLLAAAGILQRLSGWAVALSFGAWMFYTQGYGYVAHDHMALVIAAFVLPTVGTARFRDLGTASARAGWALRVVQIAVVLTYFYSVVMKWIASGNITRWANGAVIIWALMRRGAEWSKPFLEMPGFLIAAQWATLVFEFLSPVVLFLKGKWLYGAVAFFFLFHLMTYLALGIHFLPTVICWAAFLPLEKLVPKRFTSMGTA